MIVRVFSIVLLFITCEAFRLNLGFPQILKSAVQKAHSGIPGSFDVYIGNLDFHSKKEDIQEAALKKVLGFSEFFLIPHNETSHKGYGFFRFNTTRLATNAVKVLDNLVINNRTTKASYKATNVVTFSNLDPSITAPILKKICEDTIQMGCIEKIDLPTHPSSGLALGYALISFVSCELAQKAVKTLNGIHLLNKPLSLTYAPTITMNRHTDEVGVITEAPRPATAAAAAAAKAATAQVQARQSVSRSSLHSVFVHNVDRRCGPERFDSELLRILGGKVAPVMSRLCTDSAGTSKGFGFVYFASDADMKAALPLLNAGWIMKRFIVAEVAKDEEGSSVSGAADSGGKVWFKPAKKGSATATAATTASVVKEAAVAPAAPVDEGVSEDISEGASQSTEEESSASSVEVEAAALEAVPEEQPEETVSKPAKKKRSPAKKKAAAAE